jgi:putative ABC transport system permease protein
MMGTLLQDIRFGARMLIRKPGFTFVAALALAVGIGANTAIFSIVNAVLLRPLPYPDPDKLVLVHESLPKLGWSLLNVSPAEFLDYKEENEVFSEIAAFTSLNLNLTGQGEPERVQAARVSVSLFPLLGVEPAIGRAFLPGEDQAGKEMVVILSHGLWQRRFGSDPSIVGKTIRLDDRSYLALGVMPPRFQFPYAKTSFIEPAELWIPLALTDQERNNRAGSFDYGVIGRLKPGTTLPQAQANIEAVAARFQQRHPDIYQGDVRVTATVVSLKQEIVKGVRPLLLILFGAVGMVLLIACANVANLLLARASVRQKEIAIRRAMGASTLRLVRQMLTESVMLALLGGGCGLLLAVWAIDLVKKFGPGDMPRLQEIGLSPPVLGFTVLVSLLTGVLFGLAPATQGSHLNLGEALKEAGGRSSKGHQGKRLRGLLVVFETATALVLLVGAGLLINSFVRLLRVPPGFNPEGVVVARTTMPATRYPQAEQSKTAYRQVIERLSALPGVEAVGVASNLPLTGEYTIGFRVEGSDENSVNTANNTWVSNDYFRVMGIPLLRGRTFAEEDREGAVPVIVVNETMARRLRPGEDAIGKRIQWGGWKGADWLTIVGVVADVKISSLESENAPAVYMPIFQIPRARPNAVYLVRAAVDPASLTAALRREIMAVDAELPVYDVRTMKQIVAESVSQRRFSMLLIGVFAAAALILAAIGLYGVVSYSVSQRTHEIGIRMALGAQASDVLKMILRQGMALTLAGLAVGLIAAFAVTRLMSTLLFGVSATDPPTFVSVSLLLIIIALLACYIPARRATKIDPMIALRYE